MIFLHMIKNRSVSHPTRWGNRGTPVGERSVTRNGRMKKIHPGGGDDPDFVEAFITMLESRGRMMILPNRSIGRACGRLLPGCYDVCPQALLPGLIIETLLPPAFLGIASGLKPAFSAVVTVCSNWSLETWPLGSTTRSLPPGLRTFHI